MTDSIDEEKISKPFSALIPTMIPDLFNSKQGDQNLSDTYDEFGFIIQEVKNFCHFHMEECQSHRTEWLKFIEFNNTKSLGVEGGLAESDFGGIASDESFWARVNERIIPSEKLTKLVWGVDDQDLRIKGVPHSLRGQLWPRFLGSFDKWRKSSENYPPETYLHLVQASNDVDSEDFRQIEKDLLRTMPSNSCFSDKNSIGIPRLRRLLRALAYLYVDIGYCQGLGTIAATLLLFVEEETTFWIMSSIIEDLLPPSYYSSKNLLGIQADQSVLLDLMKRSLPNLTKHLDDYKIDLPMITLPWFMTLYSGVLPTQSVLRFWDVLFYHGSSVLFRLTIALFQANEENILSIEKSSELFNLLTSLPSEVYDIENLLRIARALDDDYLDISQISALRRHHLAQLLSNEIQMIPNDAKSLPFYRSSDKTNNKNNFPKQYLSKREIKPQRGIISSLLNAKDHSRFNIITSYLRLESPFTDNWNGNVEIDPRLKNVKQTEMMVDLRLAIIQIVRNFRSLDPQYADVNAQPDYSIQSHTSDMDNYVKVVTGKYRRARAIADFERRETDELGFRKNDIITIISYRDDLCWYGEFNGLHGLFPSTHVVLLDERSSTYSSAGDQMVNPEIGHLIHNNLTRSLLSIFHHGLKKASPLFENGCHPWHFIEEAANKVIQSQYSSVHSRLNLCKTFALDQDGRVLTPEELLYSSVKKVLKVFSNQPKNVKSGAFYFASLDNRFECFLRHGLNEQILHLWIESLTGNQQVVNKWYNEYSYIKSPAWVQIKCELRVLSQFSFHLNVHPDKLVTEKKEKITNSLSDQSLAMNQHSSNDRGDKTGEGAGGDRQADATEYVVKHQLFSWEL